MNVQVTPSVELDIDEHMNPAWRAGCPLCNWRTAWMDTRTEAERLLHNHLGTHNTEQGAMF